ncbi:MAG: insulinase family protein [Ignavibacteriae bacterium]|nr:MAG: insulinase family protein [Ignavibacteriota bacterium]
MEKYSITKLSNGTTIISEFIPYVKSFSLGFWFNVGTRDENLKNNGISHFIEHMLFKGTKNRSARRISEEIESYGGYLNAFTSKEHTCYYSRGLTKNLSKTFSILSDMIQNPLFKESHIKKEMGVVIDELRDTDDNPEELIFDKFEEVIFSGNPLSYPVIGTEDNIRKFNSGELQNYHRNKYNTGNLLITTSGNVNHDDLVKLAERYIRKSKPLNESGREKFYRKKVNDLVVEKDFHQVHSIIGRSTIGLKNKKRIQVKILSTMLGEGSSSRLFQAVREKLGITYQINSFLNSYQDVSTFGVYFSTSGKQAERVMDIVRKEFLKMKEKKITDKELNRVKEYIKGGMLLSLESTTNRMIRIANSFLYFNRVVLLDDFLKKVDSVTVDDITSIANELLDEKKLSKVILTSNNAA